MEENEIFKSEPREEFSEEAAEIRDTSPETDADELDELLGEFPELSALESIEDMRGFSRYRELCDMGLTPREAYLATAPRRDTSSGKSHLLGAPIAKSAVSAHGISRGELMAAREIFGELSDAEIRRLYRKVTK